MDSDRVVIPDHYTFSQRNGYEPLPEAMKLGELSDDLRREVCNVLHRHIEDFVEIASPPFTDVKFSDTGDGLIRRTLGKFCGITDYSVNTSVQNVLREVEFILISGPFHRVLSFLEILLHELSVSEERRIHFSLAGAIQDLLTWHSAAYRLVEEEDGPCWFHPCESEEHANAIADAIESLHRGGFEGAKQHLRAAAGHIDGGRHGNAITDSIHAVESVARIIDPKASKTLTPALKSLRDNGLLTHDALRKAFEILYGYTSDEQGLRHAKIDTAEDPVGVDESVFMFGACASFAGHLARKYLAGKGEGSRTS